MLNKVLHAFVLDLMQINLKRLLTLVDEVFETRNDPTQIGFSEDDMIKMESLNEACLQEASNDEGPIAWVSVIPTSLVLMNQFTLGHITERQLFDATNSQTPPESVYLCSAIVLPEFRRTGVAIDLSVQAIQAMQRDNPIVAAFVWPFSDEGEALATKIAAKCSIPLHLRAR
jgi:hypothetical protein